MESRFDEGDVTAILGGIFDVNTRLAEISVEVRTIRILLEDGDEEEDDETADDER